MKSIALVAHDGKKAELLAWVQHHAAFFQEKQLYATGTTGKLIAESLQIALHNCLRLLLVPLRLTQHQAQP